MPRLRKPVAMRPGGVLGIAAPAGPVDPDLLAESEAWLADLGFEPRRRPDLLDRDGFLAGDDDRRVAELEELYADPSVGGIVFARGGYGCPRILDRLDPELVRRARKPVIGYSDATAFLLWQRRRAGLMGFHGPMLERGKALTEESRESLARALTGDSLAPLEGSALVGGSAEGRLTGGSLTLAAASLGTPWEIETRGCILLLEDVGEQPYALDRMLQQLRNAGKLRGLHGVGIGGLVGCEGARYPVPTALEVFESVLRPLGIPVVADLPFGHCDRHLAWSLGARARIDGERGRIELLESGVSER